ncbi:toluene hydroxylase [Saccharolobus solfataricus]|uniref:Toluene-4-monooxygenase system protein A. amino end (TmoA) n=2 Tax=Saccharolobus solfataricus TaxID=2287 RepID=Q97YT1_SACS2|nr:toluene-4-monooxygenase system protein A [Saccharolobus solfataricus]AAK41473.1 Toluene-4-monooxygenase system protein A. amino end fragment (tmoA) [Saccharolobus solfataricus P2]QPG49030.1 toluene hydroxylase [Saccharolobus solfataricus]SAI84884.1 toluene-4-monooxygenase system protein A [Saccharolobus solfataricus]
MKPVPVEPRLPSRDEYYDLANKLEWTPKYVKEEELFPVDMSGIPNLPIDVWTELYDAPYKVTYREYVKNQKEKDQRLFSVREAGVRAELVKKLDKTYHQGSFCFHITAVPIPEYTAAIAEARMARFGKAGEWRNLSTFGSMDEVRHAQLQILLSHDNIQASPKFAFAHKMFWVDGWLPIAARSFFDDTITGTNAIEFALLTTFAFETGFTNLQFVAYAAMANKTNDFVFSSATQSIQTDEARHAQIGHPVLKAFVDVTKVNEEMEKKI